MGQGLAVEQGLPYALQRRASVAQATAEAYRAAVKPAPLHRGPLSPSRRSPPQQPRPLVAASVVDAHVCSSERVQKFVLTGGPCGGKTTALARLKQYLEERGQ